MRKIRPLIFGLPGAGKSTFAATFPKPMLVCLFDAPDKAGVYLDRGLPGEIELGKHCYVQNVYSKSEPEKLIITVEYWGEVNPQKPTSYQRFITRTSQLEREIAERGWQTVVLDSTTGLELAARYYSEFSINANNGDARAHYAFSMKACEQYVMTRWPNLIMANAIAIAHYDEEKGDDDSGEFVTTRKTIAVPGKLAGRIDSQWAECWRVYVDKTTGERRLQTDKRTGLNFACKTMVGFKDGIFPHYQALEQSIEAPPAPLTPAGAAA